jgi:hypothetical protein
MMWRARKGLALQFDQEQACEQDWRLERTVSEAKRARVLSIEELRQKFGLQLAQERREERTTTTYERPRIVRRREAVAC